MATEREGDETELIARAQKGDRRAFEILIERYHKRVYSVALGMVSDPESALDVSQEAFVKAYQSIGGFKGKSNFYTWIYRIAVNCSIDYLRREKKERALGYDDEIRIEDEAQEGMSQELPSPDSTIRRSELKDAILKAIETLPEEQRAAILLREIQGLSYKEIAEVLQCSKGTVMSRLHYARQKLQKKLKDA